MTLLQAIQSCYSTARQGPTEEIEFDGPEISLSGSIPDGGVTVPEGWRIAPLTHPSVSYTITYGLLDLSLTARWYM